MGSAQSLPEPVRVARLNAIRKALTWVKDADIVGIGTGSTMAQFVDVAHEAGMLEGKLIVTSSLDTTLRLRNLGYRVADLVSVERIDVYVDSADEVDERGRMIKGGGGALLQEKILATYSDVAVFVVDNAKLVSRLGERWPVPVEVVPKAVSMVLKALKDLGFEARIREGSGKKGPVITDNFGAIIDVEIPEWMDPAEMDSILHSIVGVVETGLFLKEATLVYVGYPDGRVTEVKGPRELKREKRSSQ